MNNSDRMLEIIKLLGEKTIHLSTVNKDTNSILYKQLQAEIADLRIEFKDFEQIALADLTIAIEQKDKNIQFLLDQMDLDHMESSDLRTLGKIQDMVSSMSDNFEKEINDLFNFEKRENTGNPENKEED